MRRMRTNDKASIGRSIIGALLLVAIIAVAIATAALFDDEVVTAPPDPPAALWEAPRS